MTTSLIEAHQTTRPTIALQVKNANNALTTAINQFGAFLNKVVDFREENNDADDGPVVADGFWISHQKRAETAIDQLVWAHQTVDQSYYGR